jgi:hypothetical protein
MVYPHVKSFILEHNKGQGKSVVKAVAAKPKAVAKKAAPAVKKAAKPAAKKAAAAQK